MQKRVLGLLFVMVAACVGGCLAQTRAEQDSFPMGDRLKRFLQDYLRDPRMGADKTTEYFATLVDLRDDGTKEVIVYITGQNWCGSGGCTTLVLAPEDSSFKVIARILITRPPIRVLATKSHDWHDLAVQVQGGGDVEAYEAKLSFDGKSYPISPAHGRGQRLTKHEVGKVVVPLTANGTPLY